MAEAGRWEHPDSGQGEGRVWGLGGGGAPPVEETEGEDIWKHCTAHTITIFSHAQLIFFAAFSAQGESMSGQSCFLAS